MIDEEKIVTKKEGEMNKVYANSYQPLTKNVYKQMWLRKFAYHSVS